MGIFGCCSIRGLSTPTSPAALRRSAAPLALDDVVDFEHFGLARVDAEFCEDRHQASTEGIELLLGVPDRLTLSPEPKQTS